ncbi:MAG: Cof-type HAD-IIB family hydrolase [Micropruina sp.]|uniref:Cof-type HAD-IIB family hydrolase n=1 Tax=Micropruina sp. TaxID=2737536 RepID=UPI0039E52995
MPRIIFLDVDGTLVNYANQLPDSAVRAIRRARRAGHLVYLTTGRSKAEMYPELWDIGIDGMIGGNGSYVEHQGQVVMHRTLTRDECAAVVDWLHGKGLPFYLEANSGLYASEDFETAARPAAQAYVAGKGAADSSSWTIAELFPDMIYGAELIRDDVNKISFVLGDYQDHLDSMAVFPQLKAGTWGGRGAHALFGDLGVADIDKAQAVDVLLTHLGADRADTIAMGDAAVDIPMLAYCAVGVAMGNAADDVKAVADHVTGDVDADGLHAAFEHLGLLGD